MAGSSLGALNTFGHLCVAFEQEYAPNPAGLLRECCQAGGCESCLHALGWHVCQRDREALGTALGPLEELGEMESWHLARRQIRRGVKLVGVGAAFGAA